MVDECGIDENVAVILVEGLVVHEKLFEPLCKSPQVLEPSIIDAQETQQFCHHHFYQERIHAEVVP